MKKLTLTLCAILAAVWSTYGGTASYSGKEMKQTTETPCPTWFADNEFNLGLWGAVAFAGSDDDGDDDDDDGTSDDDDDGDHDLIFTSLTDLNSHLNGHDGNGHGDFIGDTAFGGGIDLKYFFARYFGVGISAFGLFSDEDHDGFDFDDDQIAILEDAGIDTNDLDDDGDDDNGGMGAVLGTFTLRYPIPCTRFAPYIWGGGGVAFGGDDNNNNDHDHFLFDGTDFTRVTDSGDDDDDDGDGDAQAIGQAGVGLETRFTPNIGWTADFSWNFTEDDDFGMFRTGLNFAF